MPFRMNNVLTGGQAGSWMDDAAIYSDIWKDHTGHSHIVLSTWHGYKVRAKHEIAGYNAKKLCASERMMCRVRCVCSEPVLTCNKRVSLQT